ncbi:MAG: 50S ribosomal protein L22 [Phycisphaeraceae bacterium]
MPYSNTHYGARISPSKIRLVADLIRGRKIDEATTILELSKKRGAKYVLDALKAAVANADQAEVDVRRLFVSDARIDKGPTMKRFQPKDRGRAHQILKRTSHITVAVDEKK